MTKPSYEEAELKKLAETVLDKYRLEEVYSRPDQIDAAETRFYAAATPRAILDLLAELARLRGLLQRLFNAGMTVVECPQGRVTAYMAEQLYLACEDAKSDLPTFPQSSSLTSQGAESADIGKLDSADKSGVEMGKVNRVEETPLNDYTRASLLYDKYAIIKRIGNVEIRVLEPDGLARLLGSAETGGEKAGNV